MRADGDARLEAEASKLALQRVQQLLVQAAQRVCPAHAFVFELPKDAVRRSAAASAGGDLQCRAVSTIWRKLVAGARGAAVVRVETVSEFGLKRETDYTSAADLARAVLAQLPEGSREVVADARVLEEDGSLQLSTQLHMRRMRAAGMLHCAACGGFYAGVALPAAPISLPRRLSLPPPLCLSLSLFPASPLSLPPPSLPLPPPPPFPSAKPSPSPTAASLLRLRAAWAAGPRADQAPDPSSGTRIIELRLALERGLGRTPPHSAVLTVFAARAFTPVL